MAWNCKPSGGYAVDSAEGIENINEYYSYFNGTTTYECVVGMLCNIQAESGFNPWRWQGDHIASGYTNGYGLYQFTEANAYINLTGIPGHAPNLSVSQVSGGLPSDALAQMYVFKEDILVKWKKSCWRTYWNPADYPDLYFRRQFILDNYGDGSELTMRQFFTIDNVENACFAFLACYEGPQVPNYDARINNKEKIMEALGPVPPTPGTNFIKYGGARDMIRRMIIHE